jgi:hypothetical protein
LQFKKRIDFNETWCKKYSNGKNPKAEFLISWTINKNIAQRHWHTVTESPDLRVICRFREKVQRSLKW